MAKLLHVLDKYLSTENALTKDVITKEVTEYE